MTTFTFNDGGRAAAGYKGLTGDCVVCAVAIATDKPYHEVCGRLKDEIGRVLKKEPATEKRKEAKR